MWLGGLFNPEAYITATRQYVAQANGWSLEELAMKVNYLFFNIFQYKGFQGWLSVSGAGGGPPSAG